MQDDDTKAAAGNGPGGSGAMAGGGETGEATVMISPTRNTRHRRGGILLDCGTLHGFVVRPLLHPTGPTFECVVPIEAAAQVQFQMRNAMKFRHSLTGQYAAIAIWPHETAKSQKQPS